MSNKKKVKKKQSVKKQRVKLVLKTTFLLMLISILILGIITYLRYGDELVEAFADAQVIVSESGTETFRRSETSLVYDVNGDLLSVLKGEKDVYYIDYEEIPQDAVKAMISIEDKKFSKHKGIDLKANTRALIALIKNRGAVTQGASTITQQLSRNVFLTHEVSITRKVKEIFIALELEKRYTKEQIMEFYLNNIYFGNGYYGIQAASKGYFNEDVSRLSLGEIVFLCAIPNNPTLYDPLVKMDNTLGRKNRILDQMLSDGKVTVEEYNEAYEETITLKTNKIKKQNYIETFIYHCATQALMGEQGFIFHNQFDSEKARENYAERYDTLYTQCQASLFSSGYRIYTSIDPNKQKELQKSVDEVLEGFTEKGNDGIYKLQGAAVCIDNDTGKVAAIIGGRSQKTVGLTLNRGYQSFRQPGSAIKPLIVYAPAFETDYTPDTIVKDKKIKDGPKNSNGAYSGNISLRTSVEYSKNTVAWNLFTEITPKVGLSRLLEMDFSKIVKNDYYPAASLGGFTVGVSPLEMASGFSTLENDGVYRVPTCIKKITDARGDEIVSGKTREEVVYETNAARMMTNVLEGVITRGTGRGLGFPGMSLAGKTGTTDDKKDGWFVGYSPYYTTSVWVGYDIPKTLSSLSGASYPGKIWSMFMKTIHEGLEPKNFTPYFEESKPMETTEPVVEETKNPEEEIPEEEEVEEEEIEEEVEEELEIEEEEAYFEEDPYDENKDPEEDDGEEPIESEEPEEGADTDPNEEEPTNSDISEPDPTP